MGLPPDRGEAVTPGHKGRALSLAAASKEGHLVQGSCSTGRQEGRLTKDSKAEPGGGQRGLPARAKQGEGHGDSGVCSRPRATCLTPWPIPAQGPPERGPPHTLLRNWQRPQSTRDMQGSRQRPHSHKHPPAPHPQQGSTARLLSCAQVWPTTGAPNCLLNRQPKMTYSLPSVHTCNWRAMDSTLPTKDP